VATEIKESIHASETAPGTLILLMRVAIKRNRQIGIASAAIVLLAALAAGLLPNRYTATAVVLPPQSGDSTGAAMLSQLGNLGAMASMGALGLKNPNDLQVGLLKSQTVEDALVNRFHLQTVYHRKYLSSARKRLEHAAKIESGLKDGLLRISVTDKDPGQAAALANGWVDEYRRFAATLAISEASQRRLFFEREMEASHAALAAAEESMKQTEQRTGVFTIEGQAGAMIESAALLRGQIAAKQVEIRGMHEFAAARNPDLIIAEQELASLQGQLSAMDLSADRQNGDLVALKGKVTQDGLDYERALREVKYRETVLEILSRQYEAAKVDEARQGPLIQIVDPASVPDRPSSLYRVWIMAGAFVFAVPFALLIALVAEAVSLLRCQRRRCSSWALAFEHALSGVLR